MFGSTTLDRKRIYANPSSYPNPNSNSNKTLTLTLTLKRNYVFELTKCHLSIKCNDTLMFMPVVPAIN